MDAKILKEMVLEQDSHDAMTAHTVRIPKNVSQEIAEFCAETGIRKATAWRRFLVVGWEAFKGGAGEDREGSS